MERIALIHAHESTANAYGTTLGRIANVPVLSTIHGKNYYWEQAKRRIAYRLVGREAKLIAVSHRVVCLLRNKDRATAFGGHGKQRVEEQFSLVGMVNAYQKCYEQTIGE